MDLFCMRVVQRNAPLDIVKELLAKGLEINSADNIGCLCLYVAVANHASVKSTTTPLMMAMQENVKPEIVQLLLKNDGYPNHYSDKDGWVPTTFCFSYYNASATLVKLLFKYGSDTNKASLNGNTNIASCSTA
jgi:ankyrin repeat protein